MPNTITDLQKVIRVIWTCKTPLQLMSAIKYLELYHKSLPVYLYDDICRITNKNLYLKKKHMLYMLRRKNNEV